MTNCLSKCFLLYIYLISWFISVLVVFVLWSNRTIVCASHEKQKSFSSLMDPTLSGSRCNVSPWGPSRVTASTSVQNAVQTYKTEPAAADGPELFTCWLVPGSPQFLPGCRQREPEAAPTSPPCRKWWRIAFCPRWRTRWWASRWRRLAVPPLGAGQQTAHWQSI